MTMNLFIEFLLEYNKKVNLVSRQSTRETLGKLLDETLLLKKFISAACIIDAGSGSGLLGIPLAISFPGKKVVLVEPIHKKAFFLKETLRKLNLNNAKVFEGPILEFMHRHNVYDSALIARGFPKIEILAEYVYKKKVKELLLISSVNKIKNIQIKVANIHQTLYNIPSRNNLIIFKLEHVSRETQKKWVKL
jgi:16S rRNA (guanine(527)-N(7))-methyltransferase RsmG